MCTPGGGGYGEPNKNNDTPSQPIRHDAYDSAMLGSGSLSQYKQMQESV